MKTRQLGRSGLQVSALGMGVMNLSYGTGQAVAQSEGVRVIRAAVDRGSIFSTRPRRMAPTPMSSCWGRHCCHAAMM